MKRRIIQRLRTLIINRTLSLYKYTDIIVYPDLAAPIGWRDHVRWFIEKRLNTIFAWAYCGSDEEIEDVEYGEVPIKYMSDRQLRHHLKLTIQIEDSTLLLTRGAK